MNNIDNEDMSIEEHVRECIHLYDNTPDSLEDCVGVYGSAQELDGLLVCHEELLQRCATALQERSIRRIRNCTVFMENAQ